MVKQINWTHVLVSAIISAAEVIMFTVANLAQVLPQSEFISFMAQAMVVLPTVGFFTAKWTASGLAETTSTPRESKPPGGVTGT